jgi:multidrug efflux pump subunit AcrA (membrane-fusion protein)
MPTSRTLLPGLALAALILAGCAGAGAATPSADIPIVVDSREIIADGRLEPGAHAQLSFLTGGQVAEVLVAEGDAVQAGDVLARLENREALGAQAAQAEQAVLDAELALKALSDDLGLDAAQAQQEAARLQDELEGAERRLRNLKTPDLNFYEDELQKAQDALRTAEENAEITSIGELQVALQAARDRLQTATDIHNDAQKSQADCAGCEYVFAAAAGGLVKLEDARKEFDAATDAVKVLELRVAQAERGDAQTIQDLRERVDDAAANLAAARDPDPVDVAWMEADVALLQAQLQSTRDRWETLQAGPDPDDRAAAEARLNAARASLAAAQAALTDSELRAPIAGTVADIQLKPGEQVAPGVPVVTLAEFGRWVVKTTNLTEIDVVNVAEGQAAEVQLDALPDVPLRGTVESIGTVFVESRGDVTYTVTILLADADPRLRWGMTAQVTLAP